MILRKFTTPEEDRDLTIEKSSRGILLWFNGAIISVAKTIKGVEKEKQRLITKWKLKEVMLDTD